MSVCFERGILTDRQTLPIENREIRDLVEQLVSPPDTAMDKRFVYYLLGATGICVVPLTSFATDLHGFRITLLERNEEEFHKIFCTIATSIKKYLKS
jgi:aspartate/methionine/tyrosine aminotransferase